MTKQHWHSICVAVLVESNNAAALDFHNMRLVHLKSPTDSFSACIASRQSLVQSVVRIGSRALRRIGYERLLTTSARKNFGAWQRVGRAVPGGSRKTRQGNRHDR